MSHNHPEPQSQHGNPATALETPSPTLPYAHPYSHSHAPAQKLTCPQPHAPPTLMCTHIHEHESMHVYIHTHTHMHTHIHSCTHIHTQDTYARPCTPILSFPTPTSILGKRTFQNAELGDTGAGSPPKPRIPQCGRLRGPQWLCFQEEALR